MIIGYLLSEQDEERLGEIVDELIYSDFIRKILAYGDEHLGVGHEVGLVLKEVANPYLEFNRGRIIFREEKLQNLARYRTLLLPIADILFFAEGEGYSYALSDEGNSQDIVDEVRRCDDYGALVVEAERYGFIDTRVLKKWEKRGREHLRNFFANVRNKQLPEYALAQEQAKDLDRDRSDLHERYKEGRQFRQVRLEGIAMLSKAERKVYLVGDYF